MLSDRLCPGVVLPTAAVHTFAQEPGICNRLPSLDNGDKPYCSALKFDSVNRFYGFGFMERGGVGQWG